jgi:chromosomal replication initiation ATPase DnaA
MNPSLHLDTIVAGLSCRGLLHLVDAVCGRRGVTRDELCGRGRSRAVAAARHELWWLIRHHPDRRYSYSEIARLVCRDHVTVLQGVAAHDRLYAQPKAS